MTDIASLEQSNFASQTSEPLLSLTDRSRLLLAKQLTNAQIEKQLGYVTRYGVVYCDMEENDQFRISYGVQAKTDFDEKAKALAAESGSKTIELRVEWTLIGNETQLAAYSTDSESTRFPTFKEEFGRPTLKQVLQELTETNRERNDAENRRAYLSSLTNEADDPKEDISLTLSDGEQISVNYIPSQNAHVLTRSSGHEYFISSDGAVRFQQGPTRETDHQAGRVVLKLSLQALRESNGSKK